MITAPTAADQKSSYVVKSVEKIADGTDVRVRLCTLAPEDVIPWHYHSQCTDHYFVLQGTLTVETGLPKKLSTIGIGADHQLAAGTPHQISNRSRSDCRFLLVQGVGTFDWLKVEPDESHLK